MVTNVIEVSDILSNKILAQYVSQQSFLPTGNREIQGDFTQSTYKPGDRVRVLKCNKFNVTTGNTVSAQPTLEEDDTVVLRPFYNVALEYNALEATQYLDRYEDRVIKPAMGELIKQIERDIAKQAALELYQSVGVPGQPINTFAAVDANNVFLGQMDIPLSDCYMALNLSDASALKSVLQPQFNKTLNQEISFGSRLGQLSTFDVFQNNCIYRQIAGTAAALAPYTATINGTVVSGNILVLAGLPVTGGTTQANAILPGDLIELNPDSGVNFTTNRGRNDSGFVAQFVVQTFTPGAAGAGIVTVEPAIVTNGTPLQNITSPILDNTTVIIKASHNVNVAYNRMGLSIVNPPIAPIMVPYSETKTDAAAQLSLNISIEGDVKSFVNTLRISTLIGFKWHAPYGTRFIS